MTETAFLAPATPPIGGGAAADTVESTTPIDGHPLPEEGPTVVTNNDIDRYRGHVRFADGAADVDGGWRTVTTHHDVDGLTGDAVELAAFLTGAVVGLRDPKVTFDVDCSLAVTCGFDGDTEFPEADSVTVSVTGWRPLTSDERDSVADAITATHRGERRDPIPQHRPRGRRLRHLQIV